MVTRKEFRRLKEQVEAMMERSGLTKEDVRRKNNNATTFFERAKNEYGRLVLLCHRTRRIFRVKRRVQHGQRGSVRAIATSSLR
jgi:hypothetical protein